MLGFLELSLGNFSAAHEWLAPLAGAVAAMAFEEPAALRFLPDAAEALIGVGELVQASRRLDPFEKRAAQKAWSSFTAACICTVSGPILSKDEEVFR